MYQFSKSSQKLYAFLLLVVGQLTLDAIVEPAEASKQTIIWGTEWDKLYVFTANCCYLKRLIIFIRAVDLPLRQLVASVAEGDVCRACAATGNFR